MEFIHGTTLVHLKVRAWSGEKKADRTRDIKLGIDGKLPPESLLDLGRKKIFPKKALDPMGAKRKAAERACLAEGTRFMGGYAIPDSAVTSIVAILEQIKLEYLACVETFLNDFERNKTNWVAENEEYRHIIEDQIPDRETIAKTFSFDFKLYKAQPLEGFEPDELEVANQILYETGMTCKSLADRLLDRSTAIKGEALADQVLPIIKKLDTLSFGNGRILSVLNEFQHLLNLIPLTDMIDQAHPTFSQVLTFLTMCSDSDKLERIIEGRFSVRSLITDLQRNTAISQPTPAKVTSTFSAGAYF